MWIVPVTGGMQSSRAQAGRGHTCIVNLKAFNEGDYRNASTCGFCAARNAPTCRHVSLVCDAFVGLFSIVMLYFESFSYVML